MGAAAFTAAGEAPLRRLLSAPDSDRSAPGGSGGGNGDGSGDNGVGSGPHASGTSGYDRQGSGFLDASAGAAALLGVAPLAAEDINAALPGVGPLLPAWRALAHLLAPVFHPVCFWVQGLGLGILHY